MTIRDDDELVRRASASNEAAVRTVERCGCFFCGETFPASDIAEWVSDRDGRTAICPRCGIDSVLPGDRPEFLDPTYLMELRKRRF